MANFTPGSDGAPGAIFIATAIGRHGTQVSYVPQPGRLHPAFQWTISGAPVLTAPISSPRNSSDVSARG